MGDLGRSAISPILELCTYSMVLLQRVQVDMELGRYSDQALFIVYFPPTLPGTLQREEIHSKADAIKIGRVDSNILILFLKLFTLNTFLKIILARKRIL